MRPTPIHPFPARMAPEIVLKECSKLPKDSIIMDPMCGSGTTLRVAMESGIKAVGSDLDPLAVLISKVNTTHLDEDFAVSTALDVAQKAYRVRLYDTSLPWVDKDQETKQFIHFWYANKQIKALRKLITVIYRDYDQELQDFLKVAVSRIIITKEKSASLARDTSHSRPHRVSESNDYEVLPNFIKSARLLAKRLPGPGLPEASVDLADSRNLSKIPNSYVDTVVTSPPYLNAIDYMRGSKLALVWLGYRLSELREIRSQSIGAERKLNVSKQKKILKQLTKNMDFYNDLATKERNMFDRYVIDIWLLMKEMHRIIKPTGESTLVVGNSCLRGIFIKNTMAVIEAAKLIGFELISNNERELPINRRYLPISSLKASSSLRKRMRTESVLLFKKNVPA